MITKLMCRALALLGSECWKANTCEELTFETFLGGGRLDEAFSSDETTQVIHDNNIYYTELNDYDEMKRETKTTWKSTTELLTLVLWSFCPQVLKPDPQT